MFLGPLGQLAAVLGERIGLGIVRALIGDGHIGQGAVGEAVQIQPLEVHAPVAGITEIGIPAIARLHGKAGIGLIHPATVIGIIGTITPYRLLGIVLGPIEADIAGTLDAAEYPGGETGLVVIIGKVEGHRHGRTLFKVHRLHGPRTRRGGCGLQGQGIVTRILPILEVADIGAVGVDVTVEHGGRRSTRGLPDIVETELAIGRSIGRRLGGGEMDKDVHDLPFFRHGHPHLTDHGIAIGGPGDVYHRGHIIRRRRGTS